MTRLLGVSLFVLLSGCGSDYQAEVDAKVTQQWMRPGLYMDAVEYLENGGRYHDMPGEQDLDREAIMPFLKDLKQEFGQAQYAILLEDENYAWGFVMKIPPAASGRRRVEEYLEQAKQTFPGMILEEWGHEWLSLDFLNQEEAEFIRKAEAAAEAS